MADHLYETDPYINTQLDDVVVEDRILKKRLISLLKTEALFNEKPDLPHVQDLLLAARGSVEMRQRELGLLPPETPDNPS